MPRRGVTRRDQVLEASTSHHIILKITKNQILVEEIWVYDGARRHHVVEESFAYPSIT